MNTEKIIDKLKKYEARSMHNQLPVVWKKAIGAEITDINNKKYIDFTSGICTMNVGHSNHNIIKEICKYSEMTHTYTFPTEIRAKFLQYLIHNTPKFIEKAFLVSSGTEACECALKLMKMYGLKNDKNIIVSFYDSMHGRTLGAEFLSRNPLWAGHWIPSPIHLPFPTYNNNFNSIINFYVNNKKFKPEKIAGFMIETYQGWSARFYPKKYIQDLVKFARKYKALVCFDEIQGGMGRTGKLFNYMHYGITPDLICVGKGFSGGLPLSAVLGRGNILDIPEKGAMSSTHSANPLCCAIGLANFKEIQKLLPEIPSKGKILHNTLKKIFPKFEVNGKGLIAAIIMPHQKYATKICYKAMKKGLLLIKTDKESIKIAPPLSISKKLLKEGLDILKKIIIK